MFKHKISVMVLSVSIALAGCGIADSQQAGQANDSAKTINKQSSHRQANSASSTSSASSSENSTSVSSDSAKTTANPKNTSSKPPAPPPTTTATQHNSINMSTVTAVRLADFNTGWPAAMAGSLKQPPRVKAGVLFFKEKEQ
ncbi:hypothetical protein RCG23_14095 [Neobacillus sp. PS3-34]|uniref:hypothetical protein n=1 Tax=Neobacillus sp. PS3-34 TaxID=3070678 RepID=UPI0027DEE062|nr:hypothetical protein [Neobacillus sp. PS3-34]WML46772.1 hypothetical protein RCG23_14095 [Neobacillus sp. PS3-34]